jgi:hypothetical protein
MYKKMASLVVTIVTDTTAYEQQLMTYTNSDSGYVMDGVKG